MSTEMFNPHGYFKVLADNPHAKVTITVSQYLQLVEHAKSCASCVALIDTTLAGIDASDSTRDGTLLN